MFRLILQSEMAQKIGFRHTLFWFVHYFLLNSSSLIPFSLVAHIMAAISILKHKVYIVTTTAHANLAKMAEIVIIMPAERPENPSSHVFFL